VLSPPVVVLVAWTSWNDLTSLIDDPRIALALLIGSVVLCSLLVLGRSPPTARLESDRATAVKPDVGDAASALPLTIRADDDPLSSTA
jgi:hypothetical protein